ncbi:unnamed protein product [Adineta steineri]|uniref:Uncharacterized protein n=1 Tax=Adineta steineri TaxID=433720 RepID=A0A820ASN4_9BILA|nr:unnamed protein product [Adineta steineri]CAF4197735.1 unnamed protein product [Adineta steineri]
MAYIFTVQPSESVKDPFISASNASIQPVPSHNDPKTFSTKLEDDDDDQCQCCSACDQCCGSFLDFFCNCCVLFTCLANLN